MVPKLFNSYHKYDTIDEFKEWIGLRNAHSALRNGAYRTEYVDDANGVYAFSRVNDEEKVTVVLNNSDSMYSVTKELEKIMEGKLTEGETLLPYSYRCINM